MSLQTKQLIKDWGPWITLALWLFGHALALESRLSKVEQKVDDIKALVEDDIGQRSHVAADPH